MPNNSCTLVLNGHGCYSTNYLINFSNINYNIDFLCGFKETISNSHHNLLVNTLYTFGNIPTLTLLESMSTTYLSNRNAPQNLVVQDMTVKHNILSYDHVLSNASDVRNVQSFNSIDNQRFASYDLSNTRNWQGTLNIEFDQILVKSDVIQVHQNQGYVYNPIINLSQNNLLYVKPVAPQNTRMDFKLSDLLNDIFPKIKIPVSYHQNNTADIIPYVFLDDNLQNKQQTFAQHFPNIFDNVNDTYHELAITGDANIVWDACRDLI